MTPQAQGSFDVTNATGIGAHANTFITFDLNVIRAENGLAANQAFTLTGGAGVTSIQYGLPGGHLDQTSAAILIDGTPATVMDWINNAYASDYNIYSTYSIAISGSARYLTFAALSGLDQDGSSFTNHRDHVGFNDPTLTTTATPEPTSLVLPSAVSH